MAYTKFIAAIDIGTHYTRGIVGTRKENKKLLILAHETEETGNSMQRGCVYNPENIANTVKRIISKMENKLGNLTISKIYVGFGGQSLRTVSNIETIRIGGTVTRETVLSLWDKCLRYRMDDLDVIDTLPPQYLLNGRNEISPVGKTCNSLEASYKQVVARPLIRTQLRKIIEERLGLEMVDILASPLALAEVLLTEDDKEEGCVLINFGAGTTSFVIYRSGQVEMMKVIPLGGNAITQDIATFFSISETEAERIKQIYGRAVSNETLDTKKLINVNSSKGKSANKQILLKDVEKIVEARIAEIIENVYFWVDSSNCLQFIGSGIIISGGGAGLKSLSTAIEKRFNISAHDATLVIDPEVEGRPMTNVLDYAAAIGMLCLGNANCAGEVETHVVHPPKPKPETLPPPTPPLPLEEKQTETKQEEPEIPKKPIEKKSRLGNLFDTVRKDLFNG